MLLILDNIRSLYNVGSMFRTSDGFGVEKIYLCGITGTPEQNGLKKVALGAEDVIPWEHKARTWQVVDKLKRDGYFVVGLEISPCAVTLRDFIRSYRVTKSTRPIALVVGNEVNGLSPALQKRLDDVVYIPMFGVKESFNVAVACGIALYEMSSLPKNTTVAPIK